MQVQALAQAALAVVAAPGLRECMDVTGEHAAVLTGARAATVDLGSLGRTDFGAIPVDGGAPPIVLAAPVLSRGGRKLGTITVHADPQHVFAGAHKAALTELARVFGIASERLREVHRLRAADKRKDEFLAILSHELRSPLNVVTGHVELLRQDEPGSESFAESLAAIERNTRAQAQIIADLLDVSRIVTGQLKLDMRSFAPRLAVEGALDAVRIAAETKGIKVDVELAPSLPALVGDQTRVQQILWNLLVNAVKHTSHGGTVRLHVGPSADGLELVVADTGEGISPDFLPFVFDRFHQEDPARSRRHGGLGLGLSIVRHLAEAHGGSVTVASPGRDKGATFTVVLPIGLPSSAIRNPEEDPTRLARQKRLAGVRVLAVDDQRDARELVRAVLARLGAAVTLAGSGDEALALLADEDFDVLVCDVGMPVMNGITLMKQWRDEEAECGLAALPAIALTAYASEQDAKDVLAAGFQAHLAKPVQVGELVALVARLVQLPGAGG